MATVRRRTSRILPVGMATLPFACFALLLLALFPLGMDPDALSLRVIAVVGAVFACLSLAYNVNRLATTEKSGAGLLVPFLAFLTNALAAGFFMLAFINLPNLSQM